jgi:DNA-binding transcriptional ArsR family regulator
MSSFKSIQANIAGLRKAQALSRALLHPLRTKILELLQEKGRATVTEIFTSLQLEQSTASQHLTMLKKAGVISSEREKKFVYYFIDDAGVAAMMQTISVL